MQSATRQAPADLQLAGVFTQSEGYVPCHGHTAYEGLATFSFLYQTTTFTLDFALFAPTPAARYLIWLRRCHLSVHD